MYTFVGFVIAGYILYVIASWNRRRQKLSDLHKKYVLITGCDSGFGNLLAKRLDTIGINVFAGCLTDDGKQQLQKSTSNRLTAFHLDISNHDSVVKAFNFVRQSLPEATGLWSLVNNAGVTGLTVTTEFLNIDDFKRCNAVNLYGMIDMTKEFIPLIRKEKGRIINMTSVMGRVAAAPPPYAVSKFAAEGYCDCLRRDLYGTGITVHIIEPGYFKTSLINVDKIMSDSSERFNMADENTRMFYGPKYFTEFWTRAMPSINFLMKMNDASWVVDAYVHAVTAQYPKTRYIVGRDANTFFRFLWTVPEWLSDYLITKDRPKPAGLSL